MADDPTLEPDPAMDPDPTPDPAPDGGDPAALGDAGKKALDTEREQRKAAEKEAKELKAKLEAIERSQMSDQEKAIEEAKAAAKAEAATEFGGLLVQAEMKAAAAKAGLDSAQLAALLDGTDLTKFLAEGALVDADKVQSYVDTIAPKGGGSPDLGQGSRGGPAPGSDPLRDALSRAVGAT